MFCLSWTKKGEKKKHWELQKVIQGWSAEDIANSLNGYKNKTYGGQMKTIMIGQVVPLTNDDIQALAEHISQF